MKKSEFVRRLSSITKCTLEALSFEGYGVPGVRSPVKACYVRLGSKVNPTDALYKINNYPYYSKKSGSLRASIPSHIPQTVYNAKPKPVSQKCLRRLGVMPDDPPLMVFNFAHEELLTEMQSKYTGLFNLSEKMKHKLLEQISQVVFERLKKIIVTNKEAFASGFMLTKHYRTVHPHFADFQLILSTLHSIQDAKGIQKTELSESDLVVVCPHPYVVNNVPLDKVQGISVKYASNISDKVLEHINGLHSELTEQDSEEEVARKRVRAELKKLAPYVPLIVKDVIANQFISQKARFLKFRMYGEPYLPGKDQLAPILKRHQAVRCIRSTRMYNLLTFNIPPSMYSSIMAMDGTTIGGAKVIIRSSLLPMYKAKESLRKEMANVLGVQHEEEVEAAENTDMSEEEVDQDWFDIRV